MTYTKGKGFARRATLENLALFAPLLQSKKVTEGDETRESSEASKKKVTIADPALAIALAMFEGDSIEVKIPFRRKSVPNRAEAQAFVAQTDAADVAATLTSQQAGEHGFVMILQQTDAGVGQTTPGKSRRSPEIFIPLAARDSRPDFWGWPDLFSEDPRNPGKMDRRDVRMLMGGTVVSVNMMTWPLKHDFRLRSESLRSAGGVGDILKIEQVLGNAQVAYEVEVVSQRDQRYAEYLSLATNRVRNSPKRWGYY